MLVLIVLIILDFLLTYAGISLGVIHEANPIMAWTFQLPFWQGFMIRIVGVIFVAIIFYALYKMNRKAYKKVLIFANTLNVFVLVLHLLWIFAFVNHVNQ